MNAIIFGVDGIILNSQPKKAEIFSQYLNELWSIELEDAKRYWKETVGGPRRKKFEYWHKEKFGESLSDRECEKISEDFGRRLTPVYELCDFVLGALDALEFSRENFDRVFAVTGTPQKEMEDAFKKRDILKYFDRVYGTDEGFPDKKAQLANIKADYHPDALFFISHSKEEIEAGKAYDCLCIGITSVFPSDELMEAGAQETFPNLSELPDYLKRFL